MKSRALAFVVLGISNAIAFPCCGVANGEPVRFRGQTNVIVWDPMTHTEHFIRSASFETKAKDLGFIAPTPTIPELAEVSKDAILLLDALHPVMKGRSGGAGSGGFGGSRDAGEPVVIQIKEVGGFIATTLKASDAKGLAKWMTENGYDTSRSIEDWTRIYIAKNWYLTAFKVINKDGEPNTGVIKMSFKTSRAFNPYFVPRDNIPEKGRGQGLSLYFVSTEPCFVPLLPRGSSFMKTWTAPIEPETAVILKRQLKLKDFPQNALAQHFVDRSFPNISARDDLWFSPVPTGYLASIAEQLQHLLA